MLIPNSKELNQYYKKIQQNKYIAKFSKQMGAENLWHFNQYSVAMGLAVGVACAWIPLPFHTIIAVFIAVALDCNIPLVIMSIWVANPITMPIMYYYAYRTGEYLLGISPPQEIKFHLSINDMLYDLHEVWQPFLIGCFILGITSGVVAYYGMRLMWKNKRLQKKIKQHNRKHD